MTALQSISVPLSFSRRCNEFRNGLRLGMIILFVGFSLSGRTLFSADVEPVAYWGFGQEESSQLQPHGGVHRDIPGPRPDLYPDFSQDNLAVRLDGQGARYVFSDPGPKSPFDFTNGDAITMEAWVKVDKINPGDCVYVIGKGRTGDSRFAKDNQNWALRVREMEGRVCISFLFSTIAPDKKSPSDDSNWHRWTSRQGFKPGKEWHYIAIAYRFGEPESIRGVIDGVECTGFWDAGGPTKNLPTVDDDAIWIGSALNGTAQNSFRGDLDEIAIYRDALPVSTLKSRYRGPQLSLSAGLAPEVMPDLGNLPNDSVQITLHEGMPSHFRWLNDDEKFPPESLRLQTDAFLIDRIPYRYDSWGIRDSWKGPVLVRMAADVALPPGKHRFLIRVRGLSRLWVDGKLVARGGPVKSSRDGFEPMTSPAPPPKPGLRIAEHRHQEVFGECEIGEPMGADGKSRIVLETLVGSKDHRTDPGETIVAVETPDGKSFVLLQGGSELNLHLTDATVTALLKKQSAEFRAIDDHTRRTAAKSQDSFWNKRHELARKWAQEHPASEVPASSQDLHPIDAFLKAKVDVALAATSQSKLEEAQRVHREVLPILKEHCIRCHGEKTQGGLRLDSLAEAQKGGDSGVAAIQPGDAHNSELIRRIRSDSAEEQMPPGGVGLNPEQIKILEEWIRQGAYWPAPPVTPEMVALSPQVSEEAFLRRVYLDTVGVVPTDAEIEQYLQDGSADRREKLIERLLADDRWADHWMGYWLDVLAENPTLINASLNTTGPFRWYLYESFRDNKPIDRFVTELILLKGSAHEGGSAGFGIAANNDAPFAAKGQIVASAFLGMELQCARCHDSPYHSTTQKDLYALAAMFSRKPVTVPAGSRVPAAFFEKQQRQSLIRVTLKPNEPVQPIWPFAEETGSVDDESLKSLMQNPNDTREKLAALITAPQNQRFSEVIVNRVWRRLIGVGIVEPPDDWEGHSPSHPELLKWLAQEFLSNGYDLKHLTRLILTSQLYQRESIRTQLQPPPELQFFVAPERRRMTAEQLVDSLCVVTGQPLDVEELTFAPEAGTRSEYRLTLGVPDRAWKFSSLGNERDRPSLSLPRARAIADILEAFGWNGARQNPRTTREQESNLLQPGILQNSDAAILMSRLSYQSELADLAVNAESPDQLLEITFQKVLTRLPTDEERLLLLPFITEGFQSRLVPSAEQVPVKLPPPLPVVTWSNHVQPEANSIAVELEQRARWGRPADPRLRPEWREAYEDLVWSLINLSEFVWIP